MKTSARKWHNKSPWHERFKRNHDYELADQTLKRRSERLKRRSQMISRSQLNKSLIVIIIYSYLLILGASSLVSDDQRQNQNQSPTTTTRQEQPQATMSTTTTLARSQHSQPKRSESSQSGVDKTLSSSTSSPPLLPNTIAPTKLEEEVDLLQVPTKLELVATTTSTTTSTPQQPAQSTGGRQSRIYRIRAAPFNGRLQLPPLDSPSTFGARTSAPPTSRHPTSSSSFSSSSSSSLADCNPKALPGQKQYQQNRVMGDQMSASVAASSPMLRLTPRSRAPSGRMSHEQSLNATLTQLIGRMQVSIANRNKSADATTKLGATGEVDESESLVVASTSSNDSSGEMSRKSAGLRIEEQESTGRRGVNEETQARNGGESILSLIDDYDSKIVTNKTKAHLSCDSGEMILRLNFSEPFKGIVYPDHNRLSPCRFFGDGHHNYELRLPLRGCGTRQAAPRIFVNDVIVRFHKTLELEEDEVKTLICRYPPPLASTGSGNDELLLANSSSSQHNNSRTSQSFPPPYSTSGSADGALSPFELVDPTTGSKATGTESKNRDPGTTGNIESLSDNLIVAPPIGGHGSSNKLLLPTQTHDNLQDPKGANMQLNPYISRVTPGYGSYGGGGSIAPSGGSQQNSGKLLLPPSNRQPADIFNSRNSIISSNGDNDLMSNNDSILTGNRGFPIRSMPSGQSGGTFFERLSSIELLFLISSLMFLVLLALGLAGSYLCFRRREGRRSGLPGGVVGGSGGGGGTRSRSAQQQVGAILGRKRRVPQATAALRRYHQAPHLHYATNIPIHATYDGGSGNPANTSLYSHYHNLPVASATGAPSSSSPESDVSNRGLLASHQLRASGTHFAQYVNPLEQSYAPYGQQQQQPQVAFGCHPHNHQLHHHHSAAVLPPPVARKPKMASGQPKGAAVIGRRDTAAFYGYGGGVAPYSSLTGRQPMKSSGQSELLIPTYSRTTLRSVGKPKRSSVRQQVPNEDYPGAQSTGSKSQMLGGNQYGWPPQVDTSHLLHNNSNDNNNNYNHQQFHHSNLLRAKSLASVVVPQGEHGASDPFDANLKQQRLRFERDRLSHRQRHHYFSGEGLDSGTGVARRGRNEDGACSDSETEPGQATSGFRSSDIDDLNNQTTKVKTENEDLSTSRRQEERPKLLLKSIEDSFITNLTEVYEQEYKMKDTRRPLSLMAWQSMQPTGSSNRRRGDGPDDRANTGSSASASPLSNLNPQEVARAGSGGLRDGNDGSPIDVDASDSMNPSYLSSNRAKLRSLTELDVDFAKSMPFFSTPTSSSNIDQQKELPAQQQQRQVADSPTIVTLEARRPFRSSPEAGVSGNAGSLDSPDFMVSPEYDCVPVSLPSTSGTEHHTSSAGDRQQVVAGKVEDNYQKTVSMTKVSTSSTLSETEATSGGGSGSGSNSTSATVINSPYDSHYNGPKILKLQSPTSSQPNSPTRLTHNSDSYV